MGKVLAREPYTFKTLGNSAQKSLVSSFAGNRKENHMFARIFAVMAFVLASVPAFAQVYGVWAYDQTSRQWLPPGVVTSQQVAGVVPPQFVPIGNGLYSAGGNTYRCGPIAKWGGRLIGALAGNALGQEATANGHRLGGLGAVGGWVAGEEIACELFGSSGQQQPQQVVVLRQGGTPANAGAVPQGHSGIACAIQGIPEVVHVKNVETCQQIAGRMAKAKLEADNQPTSAPQSKAPAPAGGNLSDPTKSCKALSDGMLVSKKTGQQIPRGSVVKEISPKDIPSGMTCREYLEQEVLKVADRVRSSS